MKKAIALTLLFALIIAAIPAEASTPQDITIDSTMDINTGTGIFVATGPAVDAGIFCPAGTAYDLGTKAAGWQSGIRLNLRVWKKFVCTDGSGEIDMDLKVRIVYSADASLSNWVITVGTGDYTRLHGTGKIIATGVDNLVYDHYTGKVHQD
jgi:hypothetical protein